MLSDYRIFEVTQFSDDLRNIARNGHPKVVEKIRKSVYPKLRQHPHFGPQIRKLKGFKTATWRYRIGAWRFFYEIDETDRVVYMIAAAHRGSAY